ncbi:ArnT family glycosyltransferase [Bacteroides oleiciplenus]|uniref:Glycosyltransferase family 39 protein n=1 Tax=Bacteroides oleiciplenus TaxID=626931 RepID=A0A3E5BRI7_9BACE|nr:glycosyltransferase family 39 protein [Bacteroides oleiciplenus]RGN40238.1 glycosyltransferase family 39 protein [Bacteroides oleiciplenus]
MSEKKKAFWFIAMLSALVILPFLGETIFYSKGEPREAIVAFSMLESGNWILPVNYGTDIAFKPPFFYWAIAAVSSLLGGVTEYSSRLPSALAFLAMQLVFFSFIAKRKGIKTAFLASILLLSSFEVHRAAVACRVDMVQVSFIVISLCLLFRWDEKGCRGIPWLAVLLMGCATLTKGPVGSIFPCACIGLYQLLRGRSFWKAFFLLLPVGILSLIPYAAWIGAAYAQGGQSFIDLMLEENTGRFMGKMSYESHENPLWYNFLTIIWGWIPWTLVLLISLFGLKWKNIRVLPAGTSFGERIRKAWDQFRSQSPLQLFTWVVILFIFIFYCIPKSKRSVYLLPIYPFMAVLMAEYLLALVQRGAKVFKISAIIFASLCLILTATFIVVRLGLVPDSLFGTGRHAAENVAFMHALKEVSLSIPKWCLVVLPLIAAVCTWRGVAKQAGAYSLLYSIAGCMLCLFVSLDAVYQPTVLAVKSDKHLVNQIREYVPQGTVYSYDGMSFYGVNFYMNDRMRHFEEELPSGEGYVISSEKENKQLLEKFGDAYEFEEIFLTQKRSCDLRAKVYMYKFKKK